MGVTSKFKENLFEEISLSRDLNDRKEPDLKKIWVRKLQAGRADSEGADVVTDEKGG